MEPSKRIGTWARWPAAMVALLCASVFVVGQPVTPPVPSTAVTRDLLRSTNQADFRLRLGLVDTNVAVVAASAINPNHLSTNAGVLELKTGGTLPPMNAASMTNLAGTRGELLLSTAKKNENLWRWYATNPGTNSNMKMLVSYDGHNWYPATTNTYDYQDPDQFTNNAQGPYTREFSVQYDRGVYWSAHNWDPYNQGSPSAEALALVKSVDGTNWTRHALIYPHGITLTNVMFASTWFTDDDGSNYLVYSYGQFTNGKPTYVIRRLDDTYTNWSSPTMILSNDVAYWDSQLVKVGDRYDLYFYDGSDIKVATNSNLTSLFQVDRTVVTIDYSGEAPYVVKVTPNYWRLYWRYPDSGAELVYYESFDGGLTWPTNAPKACYSGNVTYWHAPGIVPPAAFTPSQALPMVRPSGSNYFGKLGVGTLYVNGEAYGTGTGRHTNYYGTLYNDLVNIADCDFSGSDPIRITNFTIYSASGLALNAADGYITNTAAGPVLVHASCDIESTENALYELAVCMGSETYYVAAATLSSGTRGTLSGSFVTMNRITNSTWYMTAEASSSAANCVIRRGSFYIVHLAGGE